MTCHSVKNTPWLYLMSIAMEVVDALIVLIIDKKTL
jgi:hypothetical protein